MKLLPLEKQIRSRKTYYSFLDKPVSQDKIDILLRNADGATPALCDQYDYSCLLYTSPSPRDLSTSRMPSSA